jgi:hypothetical protein
MLPLLQAEADRQLDEQREKLSRASATVQKLQRQLRSRAAGASTSGGDGAAAAGGSPQEQEVLLQDLKEVTRAMLLEVKALAAQHPELEQAFADAGIKLPSATGPASASSSRAGSVAGGSKVGSLAAGSRPASVAGSKAGSFKSAASQHSAASARSSASRASQPSIKTMELKL